MPVLKAEPELWLDLALVLDESHSMLIWGHTIQELKEIFKKYGIFRDIRIWGLQPDETGNSLQIFSRMGSSKRLTDPTEIVDPTGRRLILIVSDCVSNIWRKGMMFPVLKMWTEKQPLTILQMLPEWMWRRTALDLGTAVGFKSSMMGVANQQLSLHKPLRRSRSIGFKLEDRSKIPVITLDWDKAAQWSQMLIGKADVLVPGYLLPPELEIEEDISSSFLEKEDGIVSDLDAAEIVKRFRMTTSPLGRELAGLLAASPVINLPVVRLIQESLLPKSNQVQVAEVFLGGLLRPQSVSLEKLQSQESESKTILSPDSVEYEFIHPEIRDIFLDDAPISDSIDVVNAVSRYVAEQLGVSLSEFMAVLKAPQQAQEDQREDTIKPFAQITARVLRKLGGQYVQFAEELEQVNSKNKINTVENTKESQKIGANVSKANFYALLIGIGYYEPNPYYKSLKGAVQDINKVANYLENYLKIPTEQITRLTSPIPDKNSLADVRAAQNEKPPTYENIIKAFNTITETAQAGDLVYIHYSGQAGRAKTIYPDLKGEEQFDEFFVPMDAGNEAHYIRDVEFTTLIQNMLQKGLTVTGVLDCGHSGGLIDTSLLSGHYVFLAACRPTEFAHEVAFDGKERNGALTYWMIDTLVNSQVPMTYRSLYKRVKGMIQSKFPNQLPMLLGDGDRLVFDSEIQPDFRLTKNLFFANKNTDAWGLRIMTIENFILPSGWIRSTREISNADYILKIDENKEYVICDRQGIPYPYLEPALSTDKTDTPRRLVERLVHLAKYHTILAFENQNSELSNDVEYELLDSDKQPFSDPINIRLLDGDQCYLRVKNVSSHSLNIAILNFEPTWEISQISIQGDKAAFYPLQPQEETLTGLRFQVPDGEYYQQSEETLKLFVTRGNANFQWLILPPLDSGLQSGKRLDTETRFPAREQLSPLNELIQLLGSDRPSNQEINLADYSQDWSTKLISLTATRSGNVLDEPLIQEVKTANRSNSISNATSFFQAWNPYETLVMGKAEDRQYYIDFSQVRGAKVIIQLKWAIRISPEDPTCQLFTGHIGCGKSTELLRLKAELEQENFHVVYFESSQSLDMADVDLTDIFLAIVGEVSKSLAAVKINLKPTYFKQLLTEVSSFLKTPIELGAEFELSLGIAKITAKAKENYQNRSQLRQYLEPRTIQILESINKEIIQPAQEKLKLQGKKGLVIIVDGLDKISHTLKPNNQFQPEYLFADHGDELKGLKCHVVYTIPLVLVYSNALAILTNRFNASPKVLPMVAVKHKNESDFTLGTKLLQKMIMVRAFPNPKINWDNWEDKQDLITQVFDSVDTLERLCKVSGGYLRSLLSLLRTCLQNNDLRITRDCLERVIRDECNLLSRMIDHNEWQLLKDVSQTKSIAGHEKYNRLIRNLFVFEYIENDVSWFDINPILQESPKFKS